jgi:hypothetical protein
MRLEDFRRDAGSGVRVPADEATPMVYLDGGERYLHDVLSACRDRSSLSQELRNHVCDWVSLYHLTPYRATILDCLGLANRDVRVLELGAGCGAVTRWLGERLGEVHAVEGSMPRAAVNRLRCAELENVEVYMSNFFDLEGAADFDLATLIGVLEYSPVYHPTRAGDAHGAAASTLELVFDSLRDDSALIVAIENKLGLKYFSGSLEDHSSRRFDGIEGYPLRDSAVTFSAAELERLLAEAGFSGTDFFLPFPDYKLASTVLNAQRLDRTLGLHNWVETPFADRSAASRALLFNESLALRELNEAGLLRELANSFVVVAYKGDRDRAVERLGIDEEWIARHYSLNRHPSLCKRVTLLPEADGGTRVENEPVAPETPATSLEIEHRFAPEPHRRGDLVLFDVFGVARSPDFDRLFAEQLDRLRAYLLERYGTARRDESGVPLLRGEAIDATWWNIVAGPDGWQAIDEEFTFPTLLPLDYVLWRNVHDLHLRYGAYLGERAQTPSGEFAFEWLHRLFPSLDRARIGAFTQIEEYLQVSVGTVSPSDAAAMRARWGGERPRAVYALFADDGPRSFTVLAYVEELLAEPALLEAYGRHFSDADDATLVVLAPDFDPAELAEQLGGAVDRAGVTGHVIALTVSREQASRVDARAVLSRRDAGSEAHRFDDAGIHELRALAERAWAA